MCLDPRRGERLAIADDDGISGAIGADDVERAACGNAEAATLPGRDRPVALMPPDDLSPLVDDVSFGS